MYNLYIGGINSLINIMKLFNKMLKMNKYFTYLVTILIFFSIKSTSNAVSEWSRMVGGTGDELAIGITYDLLTV